MRPVRRTPALLGGVVAAAFLAASGAVLGSPVVGAQSVDPAAESVALASMLQPRDVDATANSGGIHVGDANDLDGYSANGGLREVRQTLDSDGPAETVYDYRWQFPDGASAGAFLDAAERTLAEVDSGAQPGTLPPAQQPLPRTRFYTFKDTLFGTGVVGFNYLMQDENLVAKVYVSGNDSSLTQPKATLIAKAAAKRMQAALAGAQPVVSPLPETTPSPPESSPTASTTTGPATSGGPGLDALLSHIPVSLRGTCQDEAGAADTETGRLAQVTCTASDGATVEFVLFDSGNQMDAAYDAGRTFARTFGPFRSGASCKDGGYDGNWKLGTTPAGRLVCQQVGGEAWVLWSMPATRILSLIREANADHAAAYELWLAAGPE